MKIMHLSTGLPLSDNSGVPNYVRSIATTQHEQKYEVIVVGGKDKLATTYPFKYIEYSDFYVKPFTLRENKSPFAYKKIEKIIKEEMPDLIHIHMMLDIDERLYKILKKYNIKYIISLHDYSLLCPKIQMFTNNKPCPKIGDHCKECAYFLEQKFFLKKAADLLKINKEIGKKKSPKFIKMFEYNKKLLENAELLIPVSKRVKEIYEASGIKNNYQVLHIGNITAKSFKKYTPQNNKNEEKIKLLMLGNFIHIKGGDEYIKITNALNNNFEFYFLGRSSEEDKIKMKKNNIKDMGEYKQVDLPKLLKNYDFGCVLSIWEDNAPQVVMELLNNNIPVIATQMGGIPDFIKDEHNGFLYNPYSEESFKKMINKLNKLNKKTVEKMKGNIERTTTPEEHFKNLDQIYKTVLKD